jgi:hypothetical protein
MVDHADSQSDGWINAYDALKAMKKPGGDTNQIIQSFATDLRFGNLRAQAHLMWDSEEPNLAKAWKRYPAEGDIYSDIPLARWRSHKNWPDDVANWRWPTNCFHVTVRNKPIKRCMMRGVRFSRPDLAKLHPETFGNGKRPRQRGMQKDDSRRDTVWLAIIEMLLAGELIADGKLQYDGITDLANELYDRVNAGGASGAGKNIVQGIASQAYRRIELRQMA